MAAFPWAKSRKPYKITFSLAIFTIIYNIATGRIQLQSHSRDQVERRVLRITGFDCGILVVGLVLASIYSIGAGYQPNTTLLGLIHRAWPSLLPGREGMF